MPSLSSSFDSDVTSQPVPSFNECRCPPLTLTSSCLLERDVIMPVRGVMNACHYVYLCFNSRTVGANSFESASSPASASAESATRGAHRRAYGVVRGARTLPTSAEDDMTEVYEQVDTLLELEENDKLEGLRLLTKKKCERPEVNNYILVNR